MKIAYVYDTLYPYTFGGVEKRIWELSTRLAKMGHEVYIFSPKLWAGSKVIEREGVHLYGVCSPPKHRFVERRRSIGWPIYYAVILLPALLKENFDVMDCQNFPYFPGFSAKIASVVKGASLNITWHEVWGDYWNEYLGKKGAFGKIIERWISSLSCNFIAVSDQTKRQLRTLGVITPIKVIPNGIDFAAIQNASQLNDKWDFIFAGRLIKEKNLDLLVKAIRNIKDKIPDVRCLIIGDGQERMRIVELISSLKLDNNVDMLGRLDEDATLYSHMKSSKVFVSPSSREGFGIVALEANACGLPVVTTKHPRNAMCDFISEGINGFLCEQNDEALAETLLMAKTASENISENCTRSARKYDWDHITNEIESFYELNL